MSNVSNFRLRPRLEEMMRRGTALPGWVRRSGYYGLALLFVAAAALLRWELREVLSPVPTLVFYLAWVGAAAFGGLGPGLLATVTSWLCIDLLFDTTPGQIGFTDPGSFARLAILLVGGLIVSLVGEKMRRSRSRERRQAQELAGTNAVLGESEEKYRRIVETATEGIVMADAEARMVFVNDRWSEIFGCSPEEARHVTLFDLIFPEDRAQMAERWESRKRGRKESYEFRFRRKDGSPVWLLVGVAPRLDSEGRFLGTLGMVTDITERKQAEEALRDLTTMLESKVAERTEQLQRRTHQLQKLTLELSETEDRERKRMAEVLHDDLQQVLAAAKFHLGLMRSRTRQDGALQATAGRIDEMLKDAIDKSRSLSHELSPAVLYQSDFRATLHWLADQMQVKHGLIVHIHVHGTVHLQSDVLKGFLYKAAQELLFNVVKHARVREARVRVRQYGPCICLSVSDRGRGFDPQELREAPGFGLLTIRERVELLGGRMKIKSGEGRGSTFYLVVPEGETAGTASHQGPDTAPEDRGERALTGRARSDAAGNPPGPRPTADL
jgi:PAS domain S-box-containing protein